ncbi:MAG: efflux RND transporter permease subunit [Cellvibrionaceae bacterium]
MFQHIIRHGTLVTVTVLIICVLGILAAIRIPVQMIPDLEVRTISVITRWPGATPQDVEKELVIEQEEYLRNLPNLIQLTSRANSGSSRIQLEFPFGIDMTETLIRVQNALSQVPSYPENVDQPRVFASSFSNNAFMYFRVAPLEGNPRNLDMDLMRDFIIDNVRTQMSSVPGVSEVDIQGGAERQIQIRIDPEKLAQRGIALSDVRNVIRSRNRDVSGGEVESGKRRYLLRTIGRFEEVEELPQLILAQRGNSVIRLGDVADIETDHFKITNESIINGNPVIAISVRRETGSNVLQIKEAMMKQVDKVNIDVLNPAGMELLWTADDVVYVEASVRNVWKNLILGAVFATLVMFIFLRSMRTTFIGVVGIPICTIAAFLGLLIAGRTINVISLAGIAFAIGMTLDNSIVVLESIQLERRRGLDRFQAAVTGVQKVWPAILASTLTTVMVFLPVVFITEEAGQLYSDIAIAVSSSIMISMLVAITVIPAAAANFDLGDPNSTNNPNKAIPGEALRIKVIEKIRWLIATTQRRTICIFGSVIVSGLIIFFLTPPAEYLPEGEEAKIFARMNAPPGYNLGTMSVIGHEIHEYFLPYTKAEPEDFTRGDIDVPAMRYINMGISNSNVRIIAEPKDPNQVNELMAALAIKFEGYPGMRSFVSRGSIISGNSGGTRAVNLRISGPELDGIYKAALTIYRRAKEVMDNPRIQSQPSSLTLAQPLIQIRPDWDRAAELGMTTQDIGFTVAALTDGAFVDEFFMADNKIDIYLYSSSGPTTDLDALNKMPIYTPQGTVLPLSALANIEETVDTSSINRVDGRRTVTLDIIPPSDIALETGVEIVRRDVVKYLRDTGGIPADISMTISGAADQLQSTRTALTSNYFIAMIIIYLLMVAIFTHWGYPLLIMLTIPLGIAGGIAGLWLMNLTTQTTQSLGLGGTHQPFDMISMLGFLILMGTVVNNPILIVHRSISNMKEMGMDALAAVNEAVESRLQPITISTITTICGLAPLVFLPGAGSELYRGVGIIVMAGIIGATIVTLTTLPALTVFVLQFGENKEKQNKILDS